jgi:hypothetical protein
MASMTTAPLVHDIPNLLPQRIILTVFGLFPLIICPYELWRGVWPLNGLSPFFAVVMFGGMGVGAMFVYGGLGTPEVEMLFENGRLTIIRRYLWGEKSETFLTGQISAVTTRENQNSDSANSWAAVVQMKDGRTFESRSFDTKATADQHAKAFRQALGLNA